MIISDGDALIVAGEVADLVAETCVAVRKITEDRPRRVALAFMNTILDVVGITDDEMKIIMQARKEVER